MDHEDKPQSEGESAPEESLEIFEPQSSPSLAGIGVVRKVLSAALRWQDPQIWIMLIGRFATAVAFSLFFPFLSIYLTTTRGVTFEQVGFLYLLIGLSGALSKVHGGILADRWGRKTTMWVALTLRAGTFLGLAYMLAHDAPWYWIGCLIVLASYVGHFFIPAAHALISDRTSGQKRVDAFGLFRVATNLGWAIGPALGGFVPAEFYPQLLIIMGLTYGGVGIALALVLVESRAGKAREAAGLGGLHFVTRHWRFLLYCLNITLIFTVMGQMMGILSAYTVKYIGLTLTHVGFLFSLNGLLVVTLQVPLASIIGRTRMTRALLAGSLLYSAGYLLVGFVPDFGLLALAMIIITFGEMIVQPAGLTLASRLAPEDQRGRFLGVFGMFNHLGWSIGPYLGGMSLHAFSERPWVTWVIVSGLGLVAGAGFFALKWILPASADLVGGDAPGDRPLRGDEEAADPTPDDTKVSSGGSKE
ncbi:MAG: MFS transporter [Planctomycetota bacterium]|nr:MFS transporter [Planctomycetota bacterium]